MTRLKPTVSPTHIILMLAGLTLSGHSNASLKQRVIDRAMAEHASTLVSNEQTTIRRNIPFGTDPRQQFDVYLPTQQSNPKNTMPWIFMVHGGAWRLGDKAHDNVVDNKVKHWVPKGMVLVSSNYRLLPKADPLTQAQDLAKALASVQKNAASYGIDAQQCLIMGHSAGAHLAALLAVSPKLLKAAGATPCLGAVLIDSAAMNLPSVMQRRHAAFYDQAFGNQPAYWRTVSPMDQMTNAVIPLLTICTAWHDDACDQAKDLTDRAKTLSSKPSDYTWFKLSLSHEQANEQLGLIGPYTNAVDRFIAERSDQFAEVINRRE